MPVQKPIEFYYECSLCGKKYKRDDIRYLCLDCSRTYKPGVPLKGVLSVKFDYTEIKRRFRNEDNNWNLFSAVEEKFFPPFLFGNTPFPRLERLGKELGFKNLWLKNDGLNPSGSLKDRASFFVVAEAERLKEKVIVAASTGNAASSLAAVCASTEKEAVIFVPESAPKAKLVQMILYGARVVPIKGTYDDAFRLSLEYTQKKGGLNRNTAYHPLTIEGKKTAGFEIFKQNNGKAPDVIVVPVGDGVIIAGIFKAFYDLKRADLLQTMPRLIGVQAEKSNAIAKFVTTGKYSNVEQSKTIADSISVSVPSNAYLARRAIIESDGFCVTVNDEEILTAQAFLASRTGIFAEPAAASTVAALTKLRTTQKIDKKEQIVLLITGIGLKDIEAPLSVIKFPKSIEPDLSEVV